jgi:hypothetical protein
MKANEMGLSTTEFKKLTAAEDAKFELEFAHSEIQSKVFHAEHKLRKLLERGMRVGRALRKLYPGASDGAIEDLAKLWDGDQYPVDVSPNDVDVWAKAYDDVYSCMAGKGNHVLQAYRRVGASLAAIARKHDGQYYYSARGIFDPKRLRFTGVYGDEWFVLRAFLNLFSE